MTTNCANSTSKERHKATVGTVVIVSCMLASATTRAEKTCQATTSGNLCISQIDFNKFSQTYSTQQMDEWCWAACISMIFAYANHPVAQSRIVSSIYGGPVDLPAGSGLVMAREINREWLDDRGNPFQSMLSRAFDYDAGVNTGVSNAYLIGELDADRPILLAARSHAVVLTAIQYYDVSPAPPQVVSAGVFDPWPGIGARALAPDETVTMPAGSLRFLASTSITDLPAGTTLPTYPAVPIPPGGTGGTCGGCGKCSVAGVSSPGPASLIIALGVLASIWRRHRK